MLSDQQKNEFHEHGFVRLPQVFDPQAANEMSDFLWDRLGELHNIRRDDPLTWDVPGAWIGLKQFKGDPIFAPIASTGLQEAIDDLLGEESWDLPSQWGGFLVKFPDRAAEDWELPTDGWHVDAHFTCHATQLFGLRVFTYLSQLDSRGGATLVVRGSHRLVMDFVQGLTEAERVLKYTALLNRFKNSDPWLRQLTQGPVTPNRIQYFMAQQHLLNGVVVRVEELCASPGDAIIAHPWIFHAPSANAQGVPRFQRAKDIYCKDGAAC